MLLLSGTARTNQPITNGTRAEGGTWNPMEPSPNFLLICILLEIVGIVALSL
jgi:hypothetical protein